MLKEHEGRWKTFHFVGGVAYVEGHYGVVISAKSMEELRRKIVEL